MKGIILVGEGACGRLYPLTMVTSKQLLSVYDKPMIYYPLSFFMIAGIRDILIISTSVDLPKMEHLFGDGSKFGIKLSYLVQPSSDESAQTFILGEKFISDDACALVLGDNIFYGSGLINHLKNLVRRAEDDHKATICGYYVNDPKRFGIVEFDAEGNALSIEEKPKNPKSNYCVTGFYFYPVGFSKKAKLVKPSDRGELEITALNNMYLVEHNFHVTTLGRGYSWLDTGTHESLVEASNYIKLLEEHQGLKVCSLKKLHTKMVGLQKKFF